MLICTRCGRVAEKAKTETPGSIIIELFLWLMFLIPGIIYSIWRMTSRYKACPSCSARDALVPLDSPVGQRLRRDLDVA